MKTSNISLGENVVIDPSTTINNVKIADHVKIAKFCSIYGSETHQLEIGKRSYIGMFSILNGYRKKLRIGESVSIAQNVNIMTDSGPNASEEMQKIFPVTEDEVSVGDHSWIGANVVIMPGVHLGKFCVVAANSFVNKSFPDYSMIGGNPAKLIKKLPQPDEI
ncbi:acyltransferase [Chryseobacterium takakiae]|jgi:acetyltransferase-like isoleucine patch superfamily enzyme|uniref:Transferase hexapeptide (Six repeat-containing protein) n=1 Tax=Chryseobacterium takakiae TaxID=1302685 RepID=A0A1M4VM87_9FLAO|nr:acyltransferase [Chryseobacterium takakiae]SHE69947.1 transferase hexapeptide (six repeat-containing protein) [Chryseobacterium takakiae]